MRFCHWSWSQRSRALVVHKEQHDADPLLPEVVVGLEVLLLVEQEVGHHDVHVVHCCLVNQCPVGGHHKVVVRWAESCMTRNIANALAVCQKNDILWGRYYRQCESSIGALWQQLHEPWKDELLLQLWIDIWVCNSCSHNVHIVSQLGCEGGLVHVARAPNVPSAQRCHDVVGGVEVDHVDEVELTACRAVARFSNNSCGSGASIPNPENVGLDLSKRCCRESGAIAIEGLHVAAASMPCRRAKWPMEWLARTCTAGPNIEVESHEEDHQGLVVALGRSPRRAG